MNIFDRKLGQRKVAVFRSRECGESRKVECSRQLLPKTTPVSSLVTGPGPHEWGSFVLRLVCIEEFLEVESNFMLKRAEKGFWKGPSVVGVAVDEVFTFQRGS